MIMLFTHKHVVVCWDILRCLGNLCIINRFENKTLERGRGRGVSCEGEIYNDNVLRLVAVENFANLVKDGNEGMEHFLLEQN